MHALVSDFKNEQFEYPIQDDQREERALKLVCSRFEVKINWSWGK